MQGQEKEGEVGGGKSWTSGEENRGGFDAFLNLDLGPPIVSFPKEKTMTGQ